MHNTHVQFGILTKVYLSQYYFNVDYKFLTFQCVEKDKMTQMKSLGGKCMVFKDSEDPLNK